MAHILLVDDDAGLRELTAGYLRQNGFTVTCAEDGAMALKLHEKEAYDAILLDVMMPGLDGLAVLSRIRSKSRIPVLMLTAKGDETDRIVGLEIGADDYLPKPFAPREMLARLRAVLRRAAPREDEEELRYAGILLRPSSREVLREGKLVELTGIEFDILSLLMRRAGRVVAREALLVDAGRGATTVNDRTVDVHVSHLRQKLGDDPRAPSLIKTVRGVGYVFAKDAS